MEELRRLPKVDEILSSEIIKEYTLIYPREVIVNQIRSSINDIREEILRGEVFSPSFSFEEELIKGITKSLELKFKKKLRKVVNATGIVIHTNLGRSTICKEGIKNIIEVSESYCNLEYNLETGKRGNRYESIKEYIKEITGGEDVVVVNNNAAAVLLVLHTFCNGKECIISRGELVEIGGSFRIPEIMELSGGVLKEVGTTNRTHLRDYEKVINDNTGVILKVHTSNYKVVGFTKEVDIVELSRLAKENNIPLIEDLGSGLLTPLNIEGIDNEETVKEKIQKGVDIITFSGDKLLGGPQCGIIVGKKSFIEEIKSNPFNRVVRVDKFTLAALEATLKEYLLKTEENIPTINMLRTPLENIKKTIKELYDKLVDLDENWNVDIEKSKTFVGGGALPTVELETYILKIWNKNIGEEKIEKALRQNTIPIISRINKGKVIIDGRTLLSGDVEIISEALINFGG